MIPNPIPDELGGVAILIERGEFPPPIDFTAKGGSQLALFGGESISIIGTVGTNKPDRWRCILWGRGIARETVLLCDVPNHPPSLESMQRHFVEHPHRWTLVTLPAKGAAS